MSERRAAPAAEPLVSGDLDAVFARRDGAAITRRAFVADAQALAARLPPEGAMLNLSGDRYGFAVGFAAALLRGHPSLQPANHTVHTVERLRALFASSQSPVYALVDGDEDSHGLPTLRHDLRQVDAGADADTAPAIPRDRIAAHVLTSGSTGDPVPHAKRWRLLVEGARSEARRLGAAMGRDSLDGVTLVATVPPQHMYGFESSVLLAMHGGAVLDAGRPFFAADVARALDRSPLPRALVTTPFHLKAMVVGGQAMPKVDLVVCATAPLAPQLAAAAERAFGAPLHEIYGCTEAGQVATRRTVDGPDWTVFDGLALSGDGAATTVDGGHVPQPTPLADILDVTGAQTFRLLGRSNDLVNIAGKRSSFGHLNFHLNQVGGVVDGAFWLPPEGETGLDATAPIARLVAFVVAPGVTAAHIVEALRLRVDPAFLPRRIVHVDALPREATGKLTSTQLTGLARTHAVS